MAASALVIVVTGCGWDHTQDRFFADWTADTDDDAQEGSHGGRTFFDGNESLATINQRIVTEAKAYFNDPESAGLGLFDPVRLFGGLVGL